jgi:hypothetical protein
MSSNKDGHCILRYSVESASSDVRLAETTVSHLYSVTILITETKNNICHTNKTKLFERDKI